MTDTPRVPIDPPLTSCFEAVHCMISEQFGAQTPQLQTTGGVSFTAKAKRTLDGRRFISLPHNNRIYEGDWGYRTNQMGKKGQWIGHYSVPLDAWVSRPDPPRPGNRGQLRCKNRPDAGPEVFTAPLSARSPTCAAWEVTAAARVVELIRPDFVNYVTRYSESKYPPSVHERLMDAFVAPQHVTDHDIRLAVLWKFGHLKKQQIPSRHEALILELQRRWPDLISQEIFTGSTEAVFDNLQREVGGPHRYITITFLLHLLRPNEVPIIDQHNFRAMNYFVNVVRQTHAALPSKSRPTNYADLATLSDFVGSLLSCWRKIDPTTLPSEQMLDRFLMMFGKALKAR
jgi:hypothetical protein